MAATAKGALFYAPGTAGPDLALLVAGLGPADAPADAVSFDEQDGGAVDRELAVPLLPGMDEVVVEAASLRLAAVAREMEVTGFHVTATGGGDGLVVSLDAPARLARVVFGPVTFPAKLASEATRYVNEGAGLQTRAPADGVATETLRVVVRPATKQGGAFSAGPPAFASPSLPPLGPMFGPVLEGLTVSPVSGGGFQVRLPAQAGSAWLFQLAVGDDPAALTAKEFSAPVSTVAIDALPSAFTIVAKGATAADDIVLWSNPTPLRPEAGPQDVNFQPAAQRRLSAALAAADPGAATLPVSLRFSSGTAGQVAVSSTTLTVTYRVQAVCPDPLTVRLAGVWTPLWVSAPAGPRPMAGTAHLVARPLGRELNDGSPVPPLDPPTGGIRVTSALWAAMGVMFLPAAGAVPGPALPLAAAQLYLQAEADAEVVVEVRTDAAGSPAPGAPAATVVRAVPAGPQGWVEFVLTEPAELTTGGAVWLVARTTRGTVRWFGSGQGPSMVSEDGGRTWAAAEPALGAGAAPLAQLFHATSAISSVEVAAVVRGTQLGAVTLAPTPGTQGEFSANISLPAPALAAVTAGGGGAPPPGTGCPPRAGRTATTLSLFSRTVADFTVSGASLSYSPTQGTGG
jgi:hypothetical protein